MDAVSAMSANATSPATYWAAGSSPAQAHFKMAHHLRHASYDRSASRAGISLPGLDLTGEVTSDWLYRHAARHQTYRTLTGPQAQGAWINAQGVTGQWINAAHALGGWGPLSYASLTGASPTVDLASLDFEDGKAVSAWMHYHAQLHADLDQHFGIAS